MSARWREALRALAAELIPRGLDLLAPLQVGRYNAAVAPEHALPELGHQAHLAVVVGNTRALWSPFVAALARDAELARAAHPLERHVELTLERAVGQLGLDAELRYAHTPPPRLVAMQALAELSGLAARSPAMLAVHPLHGTWIGLRGVIVLPLPGPQAPSLAQQPCAECHQDCADALARALGQVGQVSRYSGAVERPGTTDYRAWLAIRDACPVGQASRYSEEQILYHYTKDRAVLRRLRSAAEAAALPTHDQLQQRRDWRPIQGCPGRQVLYHATPCTGPVDLAGPALEVTGHAVRAAADTVLVGRLPQGGLISFARPDGSYVNTLNTAQGFARKLAQLETRMGITPDR